MTWRSQSQLGRERLWKTEDILNLVPSFYSHPLSLFPGWNAQGLLLSPFSFGLSSSRLSSVIVPSVLLTAFDRFGFVRTRLYGRCEIESLVLDFLGISRRSEGQKISDRQWICR